jgi:biopolymer transport protein ExbD
MTRRTSGTRSARHTVDCDLELRPLMNVFIVLIPMLLMSAVFMEIRVIEMSQPRTGEVASSQPVERPLALSLRVRGDAYILMGDGLAPMTFVRSAASRSGAIDAGTGRQLSDALAQIVAAHPQNHEIRIVAESQTRYQELVSLMDLARAAGLPEAALAGAMEGA